MDIVSFVRKIIEISDSIRARDHSLEKKLISNAETDLETCKVLYHQGIYTQAVYHLQQSVEKTAKAWVLFLGIVTEEDLRKKIRHKTPRTFLRFLESKIGKMTYTLAEISNAKIPTDTTEYRSLIEHKSLEVAKMNHKDIKTLLNILDKIDERASIIFKPIFKSIGKEVPIELLDFPSGFRSLYILSSITFPHYEFTRYPGLAIEPSDYTEDMGIVKALPELIPLTKKCIDAVSKLVNAGGPKGHLHRPQNIKI